MTARKTGLTRKNPAAFGTVQRRGGRYRAFYRRNGDTVTAPRTFDTAKAANAWLAKEAAGHGAGTWVDPTAGHDILADYATEWLASRDDLAPRTLDHYRRSMERWILPTLGAERLDAITQTKVRRWRTEALARAAQEAAGEVPSSGPHPARAWAKAQGISIRPTGRTSRAVLEAWEAAGLPVPGKRKRPGDGSAAVRAAYALLASIMANAEREELIVRTPCRIRGAGVSKAASVTPATPEQVEVLAAGMPERYRAAVTLAAWSGLRSGELRALARRHVDLDAGTVRVERGVIEVTGEPLRFGPPKTSGSAGIVALPRFVVAVLRDHMAVHVGPAPDDLLFATEAGGILGRAWLGAMWRRAQERSGLAAPRLRWHDLRHTGASLAYAAGGSVPDVQRRLRHTTMKAAQLYAHVYEGADHALAARMDAMFGGGTPGPAS